MNAPLSRPSFVEEVVYQHAEDAAFAWAQRHRALHSSGLDFGELERLDSNLRGHLEGLSLAGPDAWSVMHQAWRTCLPGERFAMACVSARLGHADGFELALEGLDELEGEDRREAEAALVDALVWLGRRPAIARAHAWMRERDVSRQHLAVRTLVQLREPPPFDLPAALRTFETPELRAALLELAVVLGELPPGGVHADATHHADARVRFAGALGLWRRGQPEGAHELLTLVDAGPDAGLSPRQLDLACALGFAGSPLPATDQWLAHFTARGDRARASLLGAAGVGAPALVPWLVEQTSASPEHARTAGHAIELVTGVLLEQASLDGDAPEGAEDDDDHPEEDTPWPDPQALHAWWAERSTAYAPQARGLWGATERGQWRALLLTPRVPLRARHLACWLLAARAPGLVFPHAAPAPHQRAWLTQAPAEAP